MINFFKNLNYNLIKRILLVLGILTSVFLFIVYITDYIDINSTKEKFLKFSKKTLENFNVFENKKAVHNDLLIEFKMTSEDNFNKYEMSSPDALSFCYETLRYASNEINFNRYTTSLIYDHMNDDLWKYDKDNANIIQSFNLLSTTYVDGLKYIKNSTKSSKGDKKYTNISNYEIEDYEIDYRNNDIHLVDIYFSEMLENDLITGLTGESKRPLRGGSINFSSRFEGKNLPHFIYFLDFVDQFNIDILNKFVSKFKKELNDYYLYCLLSLYARNEDHIKIFNIGWSGKIEILDEVFYFKLRIREENSDYSNFFTEESFQESFQVDKTNLIRKKNDELYINKPPIVTLSMF